MSETGKLKRNDVTEIGEEGDFSKFKDGQAKWEDDETEGEQHLTASFQRDVLVFHDFGEDFCAQEDVHHQTAQDIDDDGHIHDNIVFSS